MAVVKGEPYAFQKVGSSELTGQTVEVARAVLKKVGVEQIKFTLTEYAQMFPSLLSKRTDMAGGLYLNKSECQAAVWSVPDHIGLTAFAVQPGNPKGLKTFADVIAARATVTVMRGLPEQQYAAKVGVPAAKLKVLPGPIEMLRAVTDGQADCAAFNDIALHSMISGGLAKLDITTSFPLDGELTVASAFAFQRDAKPNLIQAFNTELTKLHESGEWLKLAEPFGFTKGNVPPADLTIDKLCAS